MNFIKILLVFLIITLVNQNNYAQVVISKSTEIVKVDGKNFYIHRVSKGETLYSISKAYGVKVDEIVKNNEGIENGLNIGQVIRIPMSKPFSQIGTDEPIAPEGFVYHKVVKGETLYRIMYNYQVSLDDLKKYNDGITANIQLGQWILIPTKEKLKQEIIESKYDSLVIYKVKKRDNYYRLEKKFGLNQQQLEQLNPILKENGIQKGIEILVPYKNSIESVPEYKAVELDSIPFNLVKNNELDTNYNCEKIKYNQHVYKIGLMIPLYSNFDKEIRVENDYLIKEVDEYISFRFIEFYQGFKMAIDSLVQLGFKTKVYVWDTKADTNTVDSICQLNSFKDLDFLFGPFYSANVKRIQKQAKENSIKVVDLFSPVFIPADSNTEFYIVKSNDESKYFELSKYIADSLDNYKISIIHNANKKELVRLRLLEKALLLNGIDSNIVTIYNYKDSGMRDLKEDLDAEKNNILFNLVDDEARISNFLRQLNIKVDKIPIMVMALDKHWGKYKTIELRYLSNLKYTSAIDYYVNKQDSSLVIPFEYKFYNKYKGMPGKLAYLGYDITWHFASAIYYYGSNFSSCSNMLPSKCMSNTFKIESVRKGVFRNKTTNIIQYDNYQINKKN